MAQLFRALGYDIPANSDITIVAKLCINKGAKKISSPPYLYAVSQPVEKVA